MVTPIEDYAVIGNGRTCALISRTGSLDWLAVPDLDSEACFAALLGTEDHGTWQLTVDGEVTARRYEPGSFVLVTEYAGAHGTAVVTECMPLGERTDLIRRVECTSGWVEIRNVLRVRFGYGATIPWAHRAVDDAGATVLRLVAGPDELTVRADPEYHLPHGHTRRHHEGQTRIHAGQRVDFTATWTKSWEDTPGPVEVGEALERTRQAWNEWCAGGNTGPGAGTSLIDTRRSLLVLRLLTNSVTGGIAAAATTSLPEQFGGPRNWDYRFCWLRDSALTLRALLERGFDGEAARWRDWLLRAVAGDPADIQIMYRIDGGRRLTEFTLPHLPGYGGSTPVRIGNAAAGQLQHDVIGEVLAALDVARNGGVVETTDSWSLQVHLANRVVTTWHLPDQGIWEIRGPAQHFVQSKVMCWLALDRMIHAIDTHGLSGPRATWVAVREQIRADVLAQGVDPATGSFVQHYGTTEVDAALLTIVETGFLPATDPRIIATVRRIEAELGDGAHVLRYRTETGVDGLPAGEHHFYACAFWLVGALHRIGDTAAARDRMRTLADTRNELGLLAEEYDITRGRFAGNFPQALSHLALLRADHTLSNS